MKKILLIAFAFLMQTSFAQNKYTPELLFKLGRVGEPEISPDGKMVVYTVRNFSLADNKGNTDIYIISTAGGTAKAIANDADDESSPHWNKDGSKIYYLNAKGTSNVWVMNADGTGKTQITTSKNDISNFGVAPAGNMIYATMDAKVDKTVRDMYPDLPKANARLYDDLMYRHWASWEDGMYSHVFVATFDGTKTGEWKDIQSGERFDTPLQPTGGAEQISWSNDGKMLAYTCKKLAGKEYAVSTDSEIYLYDVASGGTKNLSQGNLGYDVNPRFSPDGSKMIWLSMETPTYEADRNRIIQLDLKSNTKTELTKGFDYSVDNANYSTDGNMIYFLSGINATDQLYSMDLRAKSAVPPIKQITSNIGDHTTFTYTKDKMITSMMSMSMPAELFTVDVKTGATKQLTFTNKDILSGIQTGKVEKRMVKTTDGKDMLTWVIYPPDFDATKKYPTLLYCQGGPQSTVSQFFSYRWNFQLMAANGYIIVAPNRRGLPSFGTEWNRQISEDWGGQCMKDYLSAIDDVAKEPYVNKEKLGSVGASFGGYSVYWLAGHHQKRFKAFIAHCGVFNLESMYGTTEEMWFADFDMGGPYWKKPTPKTYTQFSPHDFAGNWDTPMLVIHNEKDFRVPLGQGMEAYNAARLQNIPARFLCFPEEGHWVSKPQNSVLWQRVFFEWLDKYLK